MTVETAPHRPQATPERQQPYDPPSTQCHAARTAPKARTAWAEDAKTTITDVRAKLAVITARPTDPQVEPPLVPAVTEQVKRFLGNAHDAAWGVEPRHRLFLSWWNGTSTEATYRNLHAAEACIAHLYSADDIRVELPDAVRRANGVLAADDPTRLSAAQALTGSRRREDTLTYSAAGSRRASAGGSH